MNFPFQRTIVSVAILHLYTATAWSQQAADTPLADPKAAASQPASSAMEQVVISAQRTPGSLARQAQKEAPNLVNLMTVEEMRKLPDVNIAESVRRVPGISLETDTGEGRFINIRGIDADLNSTTFGGLRLPPSNNASPFGGGRAVALDAIPTGLVGAITVTKTNLPEQDAEALGGTIEITPKTAPRNGASFLDARLGTGYEPLRRTGIADLSISAGGRFGAGTPVQGQIEGVSDRPFSLVLTASYYEDKRVIDDVEPSFIDSAPFDAPSLAYAGWDQRHYQYHRQRHGVGVDLGYEADRNNSFYARFFDAGYTETVLRNRLTITPDGSPTLQNGVFTDGLTANGFDKTLRDEKERIDNKVAAVGGKHLIDGKVLDYRLGYTQGSYDKLYDYNSDFNYTPASGTISYDNTGAGHTPRFSITGVDYLNPANYTLVKFQNSTQNIKDHESSLAVNLKLPVSWGGIDTASFKVGLNGRWRQRTATGQPYSYPGVPALSLTNASSGGNVNFYGGAYDNGPQMTPGLLQSTLAGLQSISANDAINAALQTQSDKEDVLAAYGQYHADLGPLALTGGARVESTKATYSASAKGVDASGNPFVSPIQASRSYSNFFPGVQARYEIEPTLIARAAYSTTIARPGFNQVTPSLVINPSANLVTQGNPDLKPITSNAFDFSIEQYLPQAGILSFGVFDKEFKNYIVNSQTSQTFPNNGLFAGFVGVAHVVSFSNTDQAYARGVEFSYDQKLRSVPESLDGLGLGLNYTYVDSNFAIRPGEKSTLPSTSKHTVNASVYYENHGWNLRLGAYYLSRNLWAVGGDANTDVFSEPRLSVDFGSSYEVNKQVSVYFNAKNLSNTPLTFAEGQSQRVIQREFYRQTYQVGANLSF